MSALSPREAVELWKKKELNGTALMRNFISHPKWSIALSEKAAAETLATNSLSGVMFNKNPQGFSRLYIYSCPEALDNFRKVLTKEEQTPQHYLTTTGAWIFQLPLGDSIDEILIDPASPWDVIYGKAQFARLRECAQAVEIETLLTQLRAGGGPDDALWKVNQYHSYGIVVAKDAGGVRLTMAPDNKGRALAAVFTFDDAVDAYLPEAKAMYADSEVQERLMNGTDLFKMLAGMKLDGIVFNCCGPVTPVAFALPFAQLAADVQAPLKK